MSKLRCWPGCVARIVKSDFAENIGRRVTVICRADAESYGYAIPTATADQSCEWEVMPHAGAFVWTEDWRVVEIHEPCGFDDCDLEPIDPAADSTTTDTPADALAEA